MTHSTYPRIIPVVFLLCMLAGTVFSQTVVQSMQTTNNDKVFAMNITGQKDGRPFHHTIHYDVQGMNQTQRDTLYQETRRTLGILGITDVPSLAKIKPEPVNQTDITTFTCETCAGKSELEIYGINSLSTRSYNPKRHNQPLFPLKLQLGSGQYMLVYRQKGSSKIQTMFSVKAGEDNVINIK